MATSLSFYLTKEEEDVLQRLEQKDKKDLSDNESLQLGDLQFKKKFRNLEVDITDINFEMTSVRKSLNDNERKHQETHDELGVLKERTREANGKLEELSSVVLTLADNVKNLVGEVKDLRRSHAGPALSSFGVRGGPASTAGTTMDVSMELEDLTIDRNRIPFPVCGTQPLPKDCKHQVRHSKQENHGGSSETKGGMPHDQ